jgi:hypothetical protein
MHPVSLAAAIAGGAPTAGGVTNDLIIGGQGGSVSISSAQMVLSRIELATDQSCVGGSAGNSNANLSDVIFLHDDEPGDTNDVDNEEPSDTNDVDNDEPDDDEEPSDTSDVDNDEPDDDEEPSDTLDVDDDDEESDTLDVDDSPSASGCAPLQTGQVLVNLPLNGATKLIADALVPAGTYTRLQAKLQTVEVVGVFTDANGTNHPFTLTPRMNVLSTIQFDAPVTVDASTVNLILDVGVRSWFTDRSGAVLDPTRAANLRVVESNIRASLRARS